MPKVVDARGLTCPLPVVRTRAALKENDTVVTIVDNEVARRNVETMAANRGYTVAVEEREGDFHLTIARKETAPSPEVEETAGRAGGRLVLVLPSDSMGRGDEKLGQLLIRTFLQTLGQAESIPSTIVCFNAGVKLTAAGAPTVEPLQALVDAGAELLVCGTCLDYYELKEKVAVGEVSNMLAIVETLTTGDRVLSV